MSLWIHGRGELGSISGSVEDIRWSPDGTHLLVLAADLLGRRRSHRAGPGPSTSADGSLYGECVTEKCLFSIPVYSASAYYGIYNPSRWAAVAPTLWRATEALAWLEIDPDRTAAMQKMPFAVENFDSMAFHARPTLIINYMTTALWGGLKVSREYAFQLAASIALEEGGAIAPSHDDDDADTTSESLRVNSRYADVNHNSKAMCTPAKKRVQFVALAECKGSLKKLFDKPKDWEFFVFPPHPIRGRQTPATCREVLREQGFFERNAKEDACEQNEIYIKREWPHVTPEVVAVRKT